jgi:hypothetical protein
MPDRETNPRKPAPSPREVAEKADRRFAAADVQIAELKEKGARERRGRDPETKKDDA